MEGSYKDGILLGYGNALLDITTTVDEAFLKKYNLKKDDAIQIDDNNSKLLDIFDEISHMSVKYTAGGCVQNTLRVAQWIIGHPNVSTLLGCVGKDMYATILVEYLRRDGVNVQYQYHETKPTGLCAALVNSDDIRSLVANLGASRVFDKSFLHKEEIQELVKKAKYFFTAGFFLILNLDIAVETAEQMLKNNNYVLFTLGAPYIARDFIDKVAKFLPYTDAIFCNETEAQEFAKQLKFKNTKNLDKIAIEFGQYKKLNKRSRIVVITHGDQPIRVACHGYVKYYPVVQLKNEQIRDTTGAGDAFVGGFLAQFILNKSLDECIDCAIWAATKIVQNTGCSFSGPADYLTKKDEYKKK